MGASNSMMTEAAKALSNPEGLIKGAENILKDPASFVKEASQGDAVQKVFNPENIEGMANMAMKGMELGAAAGEALGSVAMGGETLPAVMPEVMHSGEGWMHDMMKVINDGNFEGVANDALSNNAGQIGEGLSGIGAKLPNMKGVSSGLENAKNLMFRGSNVTPMGEISKIISPIKAFNASGNMLSGIAGNAQNVSSILEGKALINRGAMFPPSFKPAGSITAGFPGAASIIGGGGGLPPTSQGRT